jgi:hypothetical protein
MAFKKKLHAFRPDAPETLETQRTRRERRPVSLERGVRQLLADKVSGTMAGIWLLVPEHLRLGTWDLLQNWTGQPANRVEPRLALQMVHEAALCVTGIRAGRGLSQKGFEVANGLAFIASDQAIHDLLDTHDAADAQRLQILLGKLRKASGHFAGRLLVIDPHHLQSYTKRQVRRHRHHEKETAVKTLQTYFCLDAETHQPLAFILASSSRGVAQGAPELLGLAHAILEPQDGRPLVLADKEHYCAELFRHAAQETSFDLLVPIPERRGSVRALAALPPDTFTPHWAGFASATIPHHFQHFPDLPLHQIVQRHGETPETYQYRGFAATAPRDEVWTLVDAYPQRWHIEEFFKNNQALGWDRAGTLNLHIRYGQMIMALLAQTVLHQFRQRLGEPFPAWDALHLADRFLLGLGGDIRVNDDTILVTYYNAPDAAMLREHYEHLPKKLEHENVDPHVPWLYGLKLDFRFK